MRYLRDADVEALVTVEDAVAALDRAFRALARGEAAMQARIRTGTTTKLSTLGAVVPGEGVLGAKVYATSPSGRFRFVVTLFEATSGRPLAVLDGGALTAIRTAATSLLAARALARPESSYLVVFGAGVQARVHTEVLARAFPIEAASVVNRSDASALVNELTGVLGVPVRQADAAEAVPTADLLVTATRSRAPLFAGHLLPDGVHVSALGSTRPDARELDDDAIRRCDRVVVEWREQVPAEAGDLIGAADAGAFDWGDAVELGDVLAGHTPGRQAATDVTLFESVGVGLMDIAVAAVAVRNAEAAGVGVVLGPASGRSTT